MDTVELFDQNPWWKDKNLIEQDYDIIQWKEKKLRWVPTIIEKIGLEPFSLHILIGPRQAGKTTALKMFIKKILEDREPKSVFYFNCENLMDYRELTEVLGLYLEFKEANAIEKSIIMLDEITLPKEWYRSIKYLIDRGKLRNDVVILAGSSSISIKKEVELFPGRRGKGEDFIMYPLSFREFLNVIDPELMRKIQTLHKIEDLEKTTLNNMLFEKELSQHLGKYMEYGGFPLSVANLQGSKEEAKKTYLAWIKNAILKADRSDVIARQITKVLVETAQSDISWESISKKIEIKSPKTVAAYLDILKSMFVVNILYNVDINNKRIRFGKNKKIHFRDPLLVDIFEDWCLIKAQNKQAAIAEALVIEHLVRMFPEKVFFWKDSSEIDAIIIEKEKLYGFEVKWSENPEAKGISQLNKFCIITKKKYAKNPWKIPLSVFLSVFAV